MNRRNRISEILTRESLLAIACSIMIAAGAAAQMTVDDAVPSEISDAVGRALHPNRTVADVSSGPPLRLQAPAATQQLPTPADPNPGTGPQWDTSTPTPATPVDPGAQVDAGRNTGIESERGYEVVTSAGPMATVDAPRYGGCGPTIGPRSPRNVTGFHCIGGECDGPTPGVDAWKCAGPIPWQAFAQGDYVGPARLAHVPEYRLRVDDVMEFVYRITAEPTVDQYRLQIGDVVRVESLGAPEQIETRSLSNRTAILLWRSPGKYARPVAR